jgi:hypothetical protein
MKNPNLQPVTADEAKPLTPEQVTAMQPALKVLQIIGESDRPIEFFIPEALWAIGRIAEAESSSALTGLASR